MRTKSKTCQNNIALAEVYIKMDDLDKARDYCKKGMEIAIEAPYPFDQGKFYSLLSQVEANENGHAEKYFVKSVEIFSSLGRKYGLAVVKEQLGEVKISKEQKKDGEKYLKDARKYSRN
jgi:hypothetical protein